ncbi:MAG: hypothetical protein RMJ43_04295 [Chloroherpetonaceae bacterium]|nr:hypothetical protein [Chthonomonadaceae bacterium]MDW8207033.1 hypothetical protein [Chloroherpetonaceae bacterium]
MAANRLQILLTGFGPFRSVVSNPTERLIGHFRSEPVPGHDLTLRVLPVAFREAGQILLADLEVGGREGRPFDRVLLLGVAQGSRCWRVEQWGRNQVGLLPDVTGYVPPAGPIVADGPPLLPCTLPVERMTAAIEYAGLPAVASQNAGDYLCNYVLYLTLHYLQTRGYPARAGFLHVPADEQTFRPGVTTASCFPFARQVAALRAVLHTLINAQDNDRDF